MDRYAQLMARRTALLAERDRRMHEKMTRQHEQGLTGSFSSTGTLLEPGGRLSLEIKEVDEKGKRSSYVLSVETDGTITQFPEPKRQPAEPVAPPSAGPTRADIAAVAARHLEPAAAAAWIDTLSPGVRLRRARAGEPVLARLGGLPSLGGREWPAWEGHGPLSHVMTVDCAQAAAVMPTLGLPADGRLAFFYFEGRYDDYASTVGVWDPETQAGARLLWLPGALSDTSVEDLAARPEDLNTFAELDLTGVEILTWPTLDHPALDQIWAEHGLAGPSDGVGAEAVIALYRELYTLHGNAPRHQLGGHALPIQGPVEREVGELVLRQGGATTIDYRGPALDQAALEWQLLLQVDSDDEVDPDLMWGDVGTLYVMIRPDDLAHQRFDQMGFVWQCS